MRHEFFRKSDFAPIMLVATAAGGMPARTASRGVVVSGLLNKQVGGELGISEITVKAHRGQTMRKMKAKSLAELVNTAARLQVAAAPKG